MAIERQTLKSDLDSLFPGESLQIGNQSIDIRPLGIKQLAILARKLKGFGEYLAKKDINWDNYNKPESIIEISISVFEQFPEVLEEASNIALSDLEMLPIDVIVEIVELIIEVNTKSKDKLMGNLTRLVKKLDLNPVEVKPKLKSQKRSKN